MKLTVLVDNNSLIDQYYLAEPALSFLIQDEDKTILFDTGYSDVFLRNSQKMGIDLSKIDTLVFSHGHNDHTGGVKHIFNLKQDIDVYAHPNVDEKKVYEGLEVGMPVGFNYFPGNFKIHKMEKAVQISKHIYFLGQIARTVTPLRKLGNDPLYDDTGLAYFNGESIFVITGCSHSDICNIVAQAKKVTGCNKVAGVIGGFHLLNDSERTKEVCQYFQNENINELWPCHCTDLKAKIALAKIANVHEVGVSTILEVE